METWYEFTENIVVLVMLGIVIQDNKNRKNAFLILDEAAAHDTKFSINEPQRYQSYFY